MQRVILATILLCVFAVTAQARGRHHRHHHSRHHVTVVNHMTGGLVHIDTAAGPITIAGAIADQMTGFIADVVDRGFKGQVHCFAPSGHIRRSLHHSGNACDFAQRGWNKTIEPMYAIGDLAAKWNLRDGCTFHSRKDCGHIDAGKTLVASRSHRHRRYSDAAPPDPTPPPAAGE